MSKTEVYSWRLDPELKRALEAAARTEKSSISAFIEKACRAMLKQPHQSGQGPEEADRTEQERLNRALDEIFKLAAERDPDPDGPPTPSATNVNIRKAFEKKLREDSKRWSRRGAR